MTNINYEYAVNLQQNEGKWQERKENLHEIMRYFTKNTILQFIAMDVNFRSMELREYIDKGDRGEFLASEVDRFISDFETTKAAYEKSGISDQFAELAQKISEPIKEPACDPDAAGRGNQDATNSAVRESEPAVSESR